MERLQMIENERYEFVMNQRIKPNLSERNLVLFYNVPVRFYAEYKSIILKNIIIVKNIVNVETGQEVRINPETYLHLDWIESYTLVGEAK